MLRLRDSKTLAVSCGREVLWGMERVGNEDEGFSIGADAEPGALRVVGWGFWSAAVAQAFDKAVLNACREVGAVRLLLDMSQLKPMRDEGQRAFASTFSMLKVLGVTHTQVITASHLTRLQLLRIAREAGPRDSVQFL